MGQLLQSMDQQSIHAQAYADDIVLLARDRDLGALYNSITACLAFAGQWADANGLTFSPSKSEAIVFTWRRWLLPPLLLRGVPLPRFTRVKYLDHKLKYGEHVRLCSNLAMGLLAQVGRVLESLSQNHCLGL